MEVFAAEENESDINLASIETRDVSQGVKNIVKRAKQMTDIEWTPKQDIVGWAYEFTYYAGVTYKGLPYGQPTNAYGCRGDYVPWEVTLDKFLAAVNNEDSLIYTSYANYNSRAPYYSVDCSGFVSWAWDLPVRTTASGLLSYATLVSTSSYEYAEIGDCLLNTSAHVTLITDVTRDANGKVTSIEISESNVGYENEYCCYSVRYGEGGEYTLTKFVNKFFNRGYYLYRSNTRDNVRYTHSCAVPLEGDNCDKCGYNSDAMPEDFIVTTYPCYAEIVFPEVSSIRTLPCSGETSEFSLEMGQTEKGGSYTATALYLNFDGELWYRLNIDGKNGYVLAADTKFIQLLDSDIKLSNVVEPKELTEGKSFSLGGIVVSQYNKITEVEAAVTADGARLFSGNSSVSNNLYNLKNSTVDYALKFNKLTVGFYNYEIYVSTENCYTENGTDVITAKSKTLLHENIFKVISSVEHTCDSGELVSYGEEHPHYGTFKCSICGLINEHKEITEKLNTCALCRPAKPTLTVNYNDDCSGTITVHFQWDATANTTHYNLLINKQNEDGSLTEIDNVFFAQSGDSYLFEPGIYQVTLLSYNSEMNEPDNSGWVNTKSDVITLNISAGHDFKGVATAPTCAEIGYTTYTCSICKYSYKSDFTDKVDHIYTNSADATCNTCDYVRSNASASIPMYRMYDPNSSEHFYTGSKEERNILIAAGWNYEGVGFNFPKAGKPVHRLYDKVTGEHLYTMDEDEMNTLLNKGWNYEGVAFNSADDDSIPQYRLHNPNATRGAYHFTGSVEERDWLISLGWEYQGIGFYSCVK